MATTKAATTGATSTVPSAQRQRLRPAWLRLGAALARKALRRERLPVLVAAAVCAGAACAIGQDALQGDPFIDALLGRIGALASASAALAVAIAMFGTCSRVAADQRRGWVEPVVTNGQDRGAYALVAVATMTALLFVLYAIAVATAGILGDELPGASPGYIATVLLRIAAASAWGAAAALLLPSPGNAALVLTLFMLAPLLVLLRYLAASMEPPAAAVWAAAHSPLMVVLQSDASLALMHLLVLSAVLLLSAERTVARSA